jgi:thiol-disulfide isomerase/thioredoxin
MTRWFLMLPLLMVFAIVVAAQQPTSTWSTAKPIVDNWDNKYRSAGRSIAARVEIVREIQQLLRDHPTDIWASEAAALGFNHLNLNDDAVVVIRDYLQRFPGDDTLMERVWFFFMNWGSLEDIKSVPERWHNDVWYWKTLLRVYVRKKAMPNLLEYVGTQVLERIAPESDSGGDERIRVAETWLAHGVNPRAAERVAREAVAIAEVGDRPSVIPTSGERTAILNRLLVVNVNRSTLGWALYMEGRFKAALAELQKAAAICEKDDLASSGVFYRLGQTLEKLSRRNEALDSYFKGLALEDDEKHTDAAITQLYRRIHGTTNGLNALRRTRVNDLITKRAEVAKDLVRTVDQDLGRFEPVDYQSRPFDIRHYRGKVVIVEFWATWCGICRVTMQQTRELQGQFAGHVVVVAWSDDPEETRAQAGKFIMKMRYPFKLVFGDATQRSLEIPFLPARLILDRTGRVRVMEFGYTAASAAMFAQKLQTVVNEGSLTTDVRN